MGVGVLIGGLDGSPIGCALMVDESSHSNRQLIGLRPNQTYPRTGGLQPGHCFHITEPLNPHNSCFGSHVRIKQGCFLEAKQKAFLNRTRVFREAETVGRRLEITLFETRHCDSQSGHFPVQYFVPRRVNASTTGDARHGGCASG